MTTHSMRADLAKYRVEGRGSHQRLTILEGGPHGFAGPSLIPESSVLVGDPAEGRRIADELRSRPVLADGDVIYIAGYGDEAYVARRVEHNSDWWRLVPVGMLRHGRRYYPDFEGGGSYKIRDAMQSGRVVDRAGSRQAALDKVDHLHSRLYAGDTPTFADYLVAIGRPDPRKAAA